jgi:glycerophosphoryl diester phosphodiesterase
MNTPYIIAHRRASGREFENSRAAFSRAIERGADGGGLDVHSTEDGLNQVHHDSELPGFGPIGHLKYTQVLESRLPNGETIPTLPEVLNLLGDIDVYVEIKTLAAGLDDALLSVLDQGPAPGRYAVHSFDHRIVARLGARRPGLKRGILMAAYPLDPVALLTAAGATTLWQDQRLIDKAIVEVIHAAGHTMIAWTVNKPQDALRLAALGVDGLCGNYPDKLRSTLNAT